MEDCIFCKIIKGEIPSRTVYEDEIIKVIMNINPNTDGHLLIIPKKHYENLFDIDQSIINHSIDIIKEKRVNNCKYLIEHINNPNVIKIYNLVSDCEIPLYYPVYISIIKQKISKTI